MPSLPQTLFEPEQLCVDPRFQWHCEPGSWTFDAGTRVLSVQTDEATDFWQRTHYGFCADNGHFLGTAVNRDFQMTVEVDMMPLHQYDQAGLMVRLSADCWLKTSVEYEDGATSRLGCVVTNRGYSDWSTQEIAATVTIFSLRLTREGADYLVEAHLPGGHWSQLRLAHLEEDFGSSAVQCGIYACSPKQAGFAARFREFSLNARNSGEPC